MLRRGDDHLEGTIGGQVPPIVEKSGKGLVAIGQVPAIRAGVSFVITTLTLNLRLGQIATIRYTFRHIRNILTGTIQDRFSQKKTYGSWGKICEVMRLFLPI